MVYTTRHGRLSWREVMEMDWTTWRRVLLALQAQLLAEGGTWDG